MKKNRHPAMIRARSGNIFFMAKPVSLTNIVAWFVGNRSGCSVVVRAQTVLKSEGAKAGQPFGPAILMPC
jgi:hypothetical protein